MPIATSAHSLLIPIALFAACKQEPPPGCTTGYLGNADAGLPMQIELTYIGQDGVVHPIDGCGAVDIVAPPQGGHVMFIGVRATNLDGCHLQINAAFRNPLDHTVVGAEDRAINLKPACDRPGWGTTDATGDFTMVGFRDFANVPVCPNINLRDVQNEDTLLEVSLTEKSGRVGTVSTHVVPRCVQLRERDRAECECQCAADYTTDRCTNIMSWDAGPDDAATCAADTGAGG